MKNHPPANLTGQITLLDHPAQQAFLAAKRLRLADGSRAFRRFALFAGRRGGKTKIGAIGAAEEMAVPGSLGWACAPSYPELQDYVIPAVFASLPESAIDDWIASRFLLRLKNGAECGFRSLDDPERGRGPGLNWLWIDETRKVSEKAWNTILPALSDKRGIAWMTTSPNGFCWVYRRFWLPAVQGKPGYWAVKYRTSDNPAIDPEEIQTAREELDPLFFQQEYEGEFVSFTGAIYGTLLDTQILRDESQIRAVLPEYPAINVTRSSIVGMDPGADHPFAACLLVATDAGLVVVGEHFKRNLPAYDHARLMREMCRGLTPDRWAIDRSQRQMGIELSQHGIYATAANNDVVSGIQRVQSWLRQKKLWFIEPACPRLVEQLRNYQWAENVATDGSARREQVKKIMDDLPDCFVAGTRILTRRDPAAPIETVTTDDEVWTRDGWHRVIEAFHLAEPRPTLIITTQDGRTIRSTETHKFWVVAQGWTEARNVRIHDILMTCTQTTSEAAPAPHGVAPTDPFHTDTTSTTSMATKPITPSTICDVSPAPTISRSMREPASPFVSSARPADVSPNATRHSLDSVPTPVRPNGDATTILTTNYASARPVTGSSRSIDSMTNDTVRASVQETDDTHAPKSSASAPNAEPRFEACAGHSDAQTVVTSVTIGACELVYNLSVDQQHEYYAEGILVSNSLRYALMLWPELPSMTERPELDASERFLRDLASVPESSRWEVERLRRIQYADRGEDLSALDEMLVPIDDSPQHGLGDFYA